MSINFLFIISILLVTFMLLIALILRNSNNINRKVKKYSRWAYKYEMKSVLNKENVNSLKFVHAGIPLISDGKNMWVDDRTTS